MNVAWIDVILVASAIHGGIFQESHEILTWIVDTSKDLNAFPGTPPWIYWDCELLYLYLLPTPNYHTSRVTRNMRVTPKLGNDLAVDFEVRAAMKSKFFLSLSLIINSRHNALTCLNFPYIEFLFGIWVAMAGGHNTGFHLATVFCVTYWRHSSTLNVTCAKITSICYCLLNPHNSNKIQNQTKKCFRSFGSVWKFCWNPR